MVSEEVKTIECDRIFYNGKLQPGFLTYSITTGKIINLGQNKPLIKANICHEEKLSSSQLIIPGIIDPHVHLNEPGRTSWEGFLTGTKSAVAGGITTVVDMPLNALPPTTNLENLKIKLDAIRETENGKNKLFGDVALWGGLVPDNIDDLEDLIINGVRGFKGFLIDSGVSEFPKVEEEYIAQVLDKMLDIQSRLDGKFDKHHSSVKEITLLFHAEYDTSQSTIAGCCTGPKKFSNKSNHKNPTKYKTFLDSRPDGFELEAIKKIIRQMELCIKRNGACPKVHIVHLSSAKCLSIVQEAKLSKKLPITCETCFHYLVLNSEHIADGETIYKCCPPIRSEDNRHQIWEALLNGVISTVVSDHSPCTSDLKNLDKGDFMDCWGGVCSVGLGLHLLYTTFIKEYPSISSEKTWKHICEWVCENTSKQIGFQNFKGFLKPEYDADFVIVDDSKEFVIDNGKTYFKNKLTPYQGFRSSCTIIRTVLRGINVYSEVEGHISDPIGKCIL
ncbi:related to Allantoinase [Hanseniaspora guilliermondii]|uniref:allantoinase n=1 Tax=Hanseniaspora guilliermondii TaxID=56406 RepID=A0A1L0FIA0_9ASCO|nr:related to Allantoinase [Hanseniaspora guilliermondii]